MIEIQKFGTHNKKKKISYTQSQKVSTKSVKFNDIFGIYP